MLCIKAYVCGIEKDSATFSQAATETQSEGTEPWTQQGRRGWDELREEQGSMSITSGDLKGDAESSAPFHHVLDVTCK